MSTPAPEDDKLIVLARGALARAEAATGASVRDGDGRTYAGAPVVTRALTLTALQVAAATALSSGARSIEAAVIVGGDGLDPGIGLVTEISPDAYTLITDLKGSVVSKVVSR
ncbi:cytidine deaminase [Gordonia pseudamarae]|jgi:hypothetical protein|uniref:Cytidine deaminase n=1 Tax=Gordonia pseudamarae TaxID=2831662 RepID=A0ABX6IKR5_9ACTN|nr:MULTISPECIES: cytidine deaminase [Gordonia]MBD0023864.1 cytidine deaminase [Gordonia sp. (in: high G+C Gram-positive bacteria)]QHN26944.1 cytidine deaminase [Gordonia pseudamarae]QHN35833.1 cytidine deaminase [Gordonia pseudamarae]